MCGKIWAQNNFDGKGAIFSFSLPISSNKDLGDYTSIVVTEEKSSSKTKINTQQKIEKNLNNE